jgi:recombination protein RecA
VRLDVRRIESLKQGGEVIGNRTRIKVVKNKVAPPFKEAEFDIMFGRGISREGDILDLATKYGVVEKSGAWFAYKQEKIGQGRENAKIYLAQNPAIMEEVENKVRVLCGLEAETVEAAPEESVKTRGRKPAAAPEPDMADANGEI